MHKITFVTGNTYKLVTAQKIIEGTGFELVQEALETPEIQSSDVEEIAGYSAKWASNMLGTPVVLTDAGYYFTGLNGFPGPFIKYINNWLSTDDLLRIMDGVTNREVLVKECLAYCEPGKEPVTFTGVVKGTIALQKGVAGNSSVNSIYIPEGYEIVESEIDKDSMMKYWAGLNGWAQLTEYLRKKMI